MYSTGYNCSTSYEQSNENGERGRLILSVTNLTITDQYEWLLNQNQSEFWSFK